MADDRDQYRNSPHDAELFMTRTGDSFHNPPAPAPAPLSNGQRAGIIFGFLALFVFGVVVGRNTVSLQAGTGVRGDAPVAVTSSSAPPPATSATSPPTTSASAYESEVSAALDQPTWPTVTSVCGRAIPKPIIDSIGPPASPPDMTVLVGGAATPVNLADGTVEASFTAPGAPHYLSDMATDDDGVVLITAHCDDAEAPPHIARIGWDGTETPIAADNVFQRALVAGGDRVWIELPTSGARGSAPITLLAADDTADTVTLPAGFTPIGGHGSAIVSQLWEENRPGWHFGLFDTGSGEITEEFGEQPPGASEVANAFVDGDYVVAAPWLCEDFCPLVRHTISTGDEHIVELHPPFDRLLSIAVPTISPDGSVVAVVLYRQPPSPAPFDTLIPPVTRPSETQRIGLINLDDGTIQALLGITLGPAESPALTFSPDGNWIIVAVNDGDTARLLLYTANGDGPYDPQLSVPNAAEYVLLTKDQR